MNLPAILLAALLLASCDSGTPTSTPSTEELSDSVWIGTRDLVAFIEGETTCLADHLRSLPPHQPVRVALSSPLARIQRSSFGVLEGYDGCFTFSEWSGSHVRLEIYKCSSTCAFESFDCDGRKWSYCRGYEPLEAEIHGSTFEGHQVVLYGAFDGRSDYVVATLLEYRLQRQ